MKTVTPETVGLSSARLNRINQAMQAHVDRGKLPGLITMVARRGQIAHAECFGWMDIEADKPMQFDAVFRLASMTKPVTSVAVMMLYEKGPFQLSDPVARFMPEFHGSKVFAGTSDGVMKLVDAERDITIGDLLTFLSGLVAGYGDDQPLKELYEAAELSRKDMTLDELVQKLARLPLLHQPGKAWRYGSSYDVLARLVEVVSGRTFAGFLRQEVFEPLGMLDTGFYIQKEKASRLTAAYGYSDTGKLRVLDSPRASQFLAPPTLTSGSGNLLSTAPDYMSFAQMLLNGGEIDGTRLLGRKTVDFMTMNHLSSQVLPMSIVPDADWRAYGYGLGFRILLDVAKSQTIGSPGELCWAGYWSTHFWIDPKEDLIGVFMTQVGPPYCFPHMIPPDFKVLVYQAILD
jgi:CubicO group peptidase (beta-lactamase class C family)